MELIRDDVEKWGMAVAKGQPEEGDLMLVMGEPSEMSRFAGMNGRIHREEKNKLKKT